MYNKSFFQSANLNPIFPQKYNAPHTKFTILKNTNKNYSLIFMDKNKSIEVSRNLDMNSSISVDKYSKKNKYMLEDVSQ